MASTGSPLSAGISLQGCFQHGHPGAQKESVKAQLRPQAFLHKHVTTFFFFPSPPFEDISALGIFQPRMSWDFSHPPNLPCTCSWARRGFCSRLSEVSRSPVSPCASPSSPARRPPVSFPIYTPRQPSRRAAVSRCCNPPTPTWAPPTPSPPLPSFPPAPPKK